MLEPGFRHESEPVSFPSSVLEGSTFEDQHGGSPCRRFFRCVAQESGRGFRSVRCFSYLFLSSSLLFALSLHSSSCSPSHSPPATGGNPHSLFIRLHSFRPHPTRMVSSIFKAVFASFIVATAVSARTPSNFRRSPVNHHDIASGLAKRVTTSPEFVIYSDKWVNEGSPPASSAIAGWTVFALSFWLTGGPADMVQGWQELTAAQRTAVKTDYGNAGIKLIVAAFGSTDTPTSSGADPVGTANSRATFIKDYDLDGADIDYEDFAAMNGGTGESWLITFTTTLRAALPAPYIITHAPVAPWFTDDTTLYPPRRRLPSRQRRGRQSY